MFIWLTFCHHLCIGVWSQLKNYCCWLCWIQARASCGIWKVWSILFVYTSSIVVHHYQARLRNCCRSGTWHTLVYPTWKLQICVWMKCIWYWETLNWSIFLECWKGCAFGSGSALTHDVFGDVFVMLMCSGCLWQSSKHNRFSRITLCWGKCLMFAFWVHKGIIKASHPTVCIRVSKQYHHFSIAMNESAKVERLVECSWSTISYFPNGADPFPLQWYFHNG